MQNNAEENDYTFLIPFHSLQLTILKSMFSSVLDVSPHHFYITFVFPFIMAGILNLALEFWCCS